MRQVNVFITEKDYSHFIELVKNLHYVKKIEVDESGKSDEEILNGLKQAIEEVKVIEPGELKSRLLKDMMDELKNSYVTSF